MSRSPTRCTSRTTRVDRTRPRCPTAAERTAMYRARTHDSSSSRTRAGSPPTRTRQPRPIPAPWPRRMHRKGLEWRRHTGEPRFDKLLVIGFDSHICSWAFSISVLSQEPMSKPSMGAIPRPGRQAPYPSRSESAIVILRMTGLDRLVEEHRRTDWRLAQPRPSCCILKPLKTKEYSPAPEQSFRGR